MALQRKVILGSDGWIGSSLAQYLAVQGEEPVLVNRHNLEKWLSRTLPVDYVFYCIGLTSDFRKMPHQTVDAHVSLLSRVMQKKAINNLFYLSSTRVYQKNSHGCEDKALSVKSNDPGGLYNISKLMGEALVLNDPRPGFKVGRISNVVGASQPVATFLGSLLDMAKTDGKIVIRQHESTKKDYIGMSDVVRYLNSAVVYGKHRIYNIASGIDVSHRMVADWLTARGFLVEFSLDPEPGIVFPSINVMRLASEFGSSSSPLIVKTL